MRLQGDIQDEATTSNHKLCLHACQISKDSQVASQGESGSGPHGEDCCMMPVRVDSKVKLVLPPKI